jgi:hypothetical protein
VKYAPSKKRGKYVFHPCKITVEDCLPRQENQGNNHPKNNDLVVSTGAEPGIEHRGGEAEVENLNYFYIEINIV